MAAGNRCAGHVTPVYPQNLALSSPISGGRSVGIVRSWTEATNLLLLLILLLILRLTVSTLNAIFIGWF
jgi:hypothetical protein